MNSVTCFQIQNGPGYVDVIVLKHWPDRELRWFHSPSRTPITNVDRVNGIRDTADGNDHCVACHSRRIDEVSALGLIRGIEAIAPLLLPSSCVKRDELTAVRARVHSAVLYHWLAWDRRFK
jgi:hypothetical protein